MIEIWPTVWPTENQRLTDIAGGQSIWVGLKLLLVCAGTGSVVFLGEPEQAFFLVQLVGESVVYSFSRLICNISGRLKQQFL